MVSQQLRRFFRRSSHPVVERLTTTSATASFKI
jgi:hypothetical protein